MGIRIAALLFFSLTAGLVQAQVEPAFDNLQPGQSEWTVDPASVQGPLVIVISLADQRAWVFNNGERIATSTVSTGKAGMETPTGVFPILEKQKVHHSNRYDNAPMPFMQRLTWDGIALHAGRIPGQPASHGCVRLPAQFARELFDITHRDETVVISPDGRTESLLAVGLPEWQARQVGQAGAAMPASMMDIASEPALPEPSFDAGAVSTVMAN